MSNNEDARRPWVDPAVTELGTAASVRNQVQNSGDDGAQNYETVPVPS